MLLAQLGGAEGGGAQQGQRSSSMRHFLPAVFLTPGQGLTQPSASDWRLMVSYD